MRTIDKVSGVPRLAVALSDSEERHIQNTRRMSPVARKMVFDLAAENVRCTDQKAGAVLTLVRTPK